MIELGQKLAISLGDLLFGFVLTWPRDVALLVLGLLCAAALPALRRLTTKPQRLRVIKDDERRLKELRRIARRQCDEERVRRLRVIRGLVAGRRARQESLYLLAAAGFLVTVFAWGSARLPYLPIRDDQPVTVMLRVPEATEDEVAHLVPQEGVTAVDGWIRPVEPATDRDDAGASAVWRLTLAESAQRRNLLIRYGSNTVVHPAPADGRSHAISVIEHDGGVETEIRLTRYSPFGALPHALFGIPAWALVLTLVAAAGSVLLRLVCNIP